MILRSRHIFYCSAIVLLAIGCTNKLQRKSSKIDAQVLNTENADSVVLRYSNNGSLRARLSARKFVHATTAAPPYVDMSGGLKVEFFAGDGVPTSVLTSKSGRLFENTNDVLVRDSVVISNAAKGEQLCTSELVWNEKKQMFFTEKAVEIRTPTQIIYGDGMEANQDFTYYKVLNPRGVVAVSKGKIPVQ
ncbi:MAG: export transporter periplasmic protein LptC [Bacteroidota bacterium]|jgi:LPS export ABC transporter protein LptC